MALSPYKTKAKLKRLQQQQMNKKKSFYEDSIFFVLCIYFKYI